jgi:pimeloyl-ACP methyl ester carboxylesterase
VVTNSDGWHLTKKTIMKKSIIKLFWIFLFVAPTVKTEAQKSFSVSIEGKGQPVFLLPGFGCSAALWTETVEALKDSFTCYSFTFAGFGEVPAIDTPWLPTIQQELLAYIESKQLKEVVVIGHSLGGTLAYWLAAQKEARIAKVIAVDALPCTAALMMPNYKGDKIPYKSAQTEQMLKQTQEQFEGQLKAQIPFMCLNKEKQEPLFQMMRVTDRKTYVYGYVDYLNLDVRPLLSAVKVPVHVLAAGFPTKEIAGKTYQNQFQQLPQAQIEFAPRSAHFLMYDEADWYLQKVKAILQEKKG